MKITLSVILVLGLVGLALFNIGGCVVKDGTYSLSGGCWPGQPCFQKWACYSATVQPCLEKCLAEGNTHEQCWKPIARPEGGLTTKVGLCQISRCGA